MGKTKQERARALLREERSGTLKLAFAYMTMWGSVTDSDSDRLIDERLTLLENSLRTMQ